MQGSLGKPIIVVNVPGAAGNIGRLAWAQLPMAILSGYGLLVHPRCERRGLRTPVPMYERFRGNRAARPQSALDCSKKAIPADDLKEFIGWLKANP